MPSVEKLFEIKDTSVLLLFLSALGIYVSVILYTRIFGKRSFSKMSSSDFAMTIAIGSIIASTILSSFVSLIEGAIALFFVYFIQTAAAFLRRISWFQQIVDNSPLFLMKGEEILYENLKKSHVTISDIKSKLREANVTQLSQVKAVIFETTGDISVLHKDDHKEIDPWIIDEVMDH
ncbi:DUF421 domain-containing protein [Aquimarina sp. ERC-38]|uniref:DUF421 domain-containing protein n=1 Tax=Aquimarina sp. ERC-38 TaxID=2949996 RepID=UPI0022477792|nr:YetF domain-containing protein [Aquimarina sp. ERC-38]UZO81155.1 DUF421 domain-containing protein [Aquimarina sp. ERC-38]